MAFYFITHMLCPDTCLYGHFDVLYVISRYMFISWTLWCFICYFHIHVYIMDTFMFYMLFPDTCLYGDFDVLYMLFLDIWYMIYFYTFDMGTLFSRYMYMYVIDFLMYTCVSYWSFNVLIFYVYVCVMFTCFYICYSS